MHLLRTTLLLTIMGVLLVVILPACGGGETSGSSGGGETTASGGNPYDPRASMASLQDAGWQAEENPEDAPEPYTGVRLVGYLETTAPDGEPIDLEFYESPEDAQGELKETQKEEAPFEGVTVGNVIASDPDNDTAAVSQQNLDALQGLLR